MSELHNISHSQTLDILDVTSEIHITSQIQFSSLNKIITINGVFSNQAETWYTLATNLGFMVFKYNNKSLELLKECNYQKFEVM